MLNITVQTSIGPAIAKLSYVQSKQVPFATALALTKTGQAVKAAITDDQFAVVLITHKRAICRLQKAF